MAKDRERWRLSVFAVPGLGVQSSWRPIVSADGLRRDGTHWPELFGTWLPHPILEGYDFFWLRLGFAESEGRPD